MNKDNREIYRSFCSKETDLPIFFQDWWLEVITSVVGGSWNAAIKYKNGKIAGVLPYTYKNGVIIPHPMTPRLGPYILFPDKQKYQTRLHHETEVLTELVNDLPDFSYYAQYFFYNTLNWQPFYWQNFKATPRYSYIIKAGTTEEELENGMHTNLRNSLRKAAGNLTVVEIDDVKTVYDLADAVCSRKGLKNLITLDLYKALDKACKMRNCRKIFAAYDANGKLHAAEYFVYDQHFVYAIAGGSDPQYRNSQAVSLLHKEGILFALRSGRAFDFEGTMLKEVEPQFRQFGAEQTMYLHVWKDNRSLIKRSLDYLKRRING